MRKNQCVSEKLNGKSKVAFDTKEEAEAFLGDGLKYNDVYLCDNGGCGKWHTSSGSKKKRADPNSNRQRKRRERRERKKL